MFELAAPLAESWAGSGSHGTGNVDVLCAVMGVEREAAQLHAFRLAVGRFLFQMCMDPPVICRDNSRTA
jgi:hypothetical protein